MDYLEAMNCTVTYDEAEGEINKHGGSMEDFEADYGVHEEYEGSDVLAWLGY